MADANDDILEQFKEFMTAKAASEKETAESEDYDVEIWDEKGRGARVKRSHAKPFLQSLGIDIDPSTDGSTDGDTDGGTTGGRKSTGAKGATTPPASTVRKYFSPKTK